MDIDAISEFFLKIANMTFLGVSVWQYVLSAVVLYLSLPIKRWIEAHLIRTTLQNIASASGRYQKLLFDAIHKPLGATVLLAGIYFAVLILSIGETVSDQLVRVLNSAYYFAFMVIFVWTIYRLIEVFVVWVEDMSKRQDYGIQQFVPLIRQTLRLSIIIIGALTILSVLDFDVQGLIAGLGIGGIAVALAAQDSLGNLFGSLSIIADRPFHVGDWIMVGNKWEGFVEEIGFRSTKIRTWPKTVLTIPNKTLANEVIDNLSQMPRRRVKNVLGVTYDTPRDKIEALIERVEIILKEDEGIHKEFILVKFHEFGDSSLDIMMIFFTLAIRGHAYYGTLQRVNLKIMQALEEIGVDLAYPTQSIYLENNKDTSSMLPAP